MRRMLRVVGWVGLGLSAILFVATVGLWVRSLGHSEHWNYERFEANAEWGEPLVGAGTNHYWSVAAIYGRFSVVYGRFAPIPAVTSSSSGGPTRWYHARVPITAPAAKQHYDSSWTPGERAWQGGAQRNWRVAGVDLSHWYTRVAPATGRPQTEFYSINLPFWMLAVVFGIWPGVFVVRRVFRRKRFGAGMCQNCGYDLRATPERCPECGTTVEDKK